MRWGPAIAFVNATVVTDEGRYVDAIRIRERVIDRLGGRPAGGDTVIDLDGAIVLPGLINAHDHLELNSFPRLKWRAEYTNVREWIADFQPRFATDPELAAARSETLVGRVWIGGLKNLLSGVTTVCHHNPLHRPLREPFPVRIVRKYGVSHSLQIDGRRVADVYRRTPSDWPWIIHAAEGVDEEARAEIETLSGLGCLGANTVLVHGVAMDDAGAARVLASGGALVWCPTSNHFLFGATASVRRFADARRLAIGSDSRLSGAGDLLDELHAAHGTGQVTPAALVRAVTCDAAAILRLPRAGRLECGSPADLTVLRHRSAERDESIVTATRQDVRLTMIDGTPLYADPALGDVFGAHGDSFERVGVDGAERFLAPWIARRAAAIEFREPGLEIA